MKKTYFNVEQNGFYGVYTPCKKKSEFAIIAMLGDNPDDFLARSAVKWLTEKGVNVLTMSPGKNNYSHCNYPLERIENAVKWLKNNQNNKIGIAGASTTGTLALTAASYFSDISLTVAMTPSDFIWQGFEQGEKDGCREWPVEGTSIFSYRGKPLSFMPFVYKHPQYWQIVKEESKRCGDTINSRKLFDDSEKAHTHTDDEMIKVENIRGKLLVIGACDDALWDTAKYIRRMEKRFDEKHGGCNAEFAVYEHGTHFVFPQGMMKKMLPIGSGLLVKMAFSAAKKYPKECKQTRIDIDRKITKAILGWRES